MPGAIPTNADQSDLPAGLASPARRALAAAGMNRLEQLATLSEDELLKLHGMGPKAIRIIQQAMAERGLTFAPQGASNNISGRANE